MLRCVVLPILVLASSAGNVAAQAVCAVRGVWELESATVDGEPRDLAGWKQMKIVTDTRFAFVTQQGTTAPLVTTSDSLTAYRTRFFGGGTYRVTPTTYTEVLHYFMNPEYVGREITFNCRIESDRWYHDAEYPVLENGMQIGSRRLAEVWRRVE